MDLERRQSKSSHCDLRGRKHYWPRAKIACDSCRIRRQKCVVPKGAESCTLCSSRGEHCEFNNHDQRRIRFSRAYVSSLCDHIVLLEDILRKKNIKLPYKKFRPINPSPTTLSKLHLQCLPATSFQQNSQVEIGKSSITQSVKSADVTSASFGNKLQIIQEQRREESDGFNFVPQISPKLPTGGRSPCDQKASTNKLSAKELLNTVPLACYDYLMARFWAWFSPTNPLLPKEHFKDRFADEGGSCNFELLELCMLSTGLHYAEKDRPEMQHFALHGLDSAFCDEVTNLLSLEMEATNRICKVAGFVILSDLEFALGMEDQGKAYSDAAINASLLMAPKSNFPSLSSRSSVCEIETYQTVLLSCITHGVFWSLWQARTVAEPESNDGRSLLGEHLASMDGDCENWIREQWTGITKFTRDIKDLFDTKMGQDPLIAKRTLLRATDLDRQLTHWHRSLPEELRRGQEDASRKAIIFLALHLPYHFTLIILHWPNLGYDTTSGSNAVWVGTTFSTLSSTARSLCTYHAIRIIEIFSSRREILKKMHLFLFALQYIATAALVLLASFLLCPEKGLTTEMVAHLEVLKEVLADLAQTSEPAKQLHDSLSSALAELRLTITMDGQDITNEVKFSPQKEVIHDDACSAGGAGFDSPIGPYDPDVLYLAEVHIPELFSI